MSTGGDNRDGMFVKRAPRFLHVVHADGDFITEETIRANKEHDSKYGWSPQCPMVYTNNRRLPETVVLPSGLTSDDDVWDAILDNESEML